VQTVVLFFFHRLSFTVYLLDASCVLIVFSTAPSSMSPWWFCKYLYCVVDCCLFVIALSQCLIFSILTKEIPKESGISSDLVFFLSVQVRD
jgi:hypothetical protein